MSTTVKYQWQTSTGKVAQEHDSEDLAHEWMAEQLEKHSKFAQLLTLFKVVTTVVVTEVQ